MGDELYRVAWTAVQEDGSRVTLRSPEYRSLDAATADRDAAQALEYVTDAWIERAEWQRVSDADEQGSVRQFSCIHGVEPDGWCAQCDPEESARYLDSLGDGPAAGRDLHG